MNIKVIVDLKSPELNQKKEYNGTFEENRILYNDDTNVMIDLDNKKLRRENDSYIIDLDFNNDKYELHLKEYDMVTPLDVNLDSFLINENKVEIKYHFKSDLDNKIEYKIESYDN